MTEMDEVIAQLTKKKRAVADAEAELARLDGRREGIMEALDNDFGVKTLGGAEKKLTALSDAIDNDEAELKDGVAKLEDDYDWG